MGAFSTAFGAGLQRGGQDRAHKRALSDEEHEQALADHNNTIQAIQQKMSQVGPNDPAYAGYQNQLNQVQTDRSSLFHPDQPGGLERLGKMLWEKVHGPTTPKMEQTQAVESQETLPNGTVLPAPTAPVISHPVATAGEMKARAAQELGWGAPATPKPVVGTPQWLEGADGVKKPFALQDGKYVPVQGADGYAPADKPVAPLHPALKEYKLKDGTMAWLDANKPDELPEGAQPIAGQPHQSTSALESYVRSWFPNGASAKQREWAITRLNRLNHPNSNSAHDSIQYDEFGNPKMVRLTAENRKDFSGPEGPPPPDEAAPAAPAPGAKTALPTAPPVTPAILKKHVASAKTTAQPAASPRAKVDHRLDGVHKNTPDQTAAHKRVSDATYLSSIADQAQKTHSAASDKVLVGLLQKTIEGRFNQGAYDNLSARYGLGNRFEKWLNDQQSGQLPDDVRNQLVNEAHEVLTAANAAQTAASGKSANLVDDFLKNF